MIHFQGIMLEIYCTLVKYSLVYFNVENTGKLCWCSQLYSDEYILSEIQKDRPTGQVYTLKMNRKYH